MVYTYDMCICSQCSADFVSINMMTELVFVLQNYDNHYFSAHLFIFSNV